MDQMNITDGNDLALAAAELATLCDIILDLILCTTNDSDARRKTLERINLLIDIMLPVAHKIDEATTEHLWAPLVKTIPEVHENE